ncbi:MAG TPA: hypothetical protein VFV33_04855 [Gemmatimonadaceae bacterium]|nr:hypothetical protein [Gemmatimonadaceae bacterium]
MTAVLYSLLVIIGVMIVASVIAAAVRATKILLRRTRHHVPVP